VKEILKADELVGGNFYHMFDGDRFDGTHGTDEFYQDYNLDFIFYKGSNIRVFGPIELPTLEEIEKECE